MERLEAVEMRSRVLELHVQVVLAGWQFGEVQPAKVLLREDDLLTDDLGSALDDRQLSPNLGRPVRRAALGRHADVQALDMSDEVLLDRVDELNGMLRLLERHCLAGDLPAILGVSDGELAESVGEVGQRHPEGALLDARFKLDLSF